jgi:hypothetical protein
MSLPDSGFATIPTAFLGDIVIESRYTVSIENATIAVSTSRGKNDLKLT